MTPILGIIASGISGFLQGTASGGSETTSGGYKYHTFTSNGTLTVSSALKNAEVLVVAGGGGGSGGGGGAGGLKQLSKPTISVGSKTVTIGGGGTAGRQLDLIGGDGSNSVFDSDTSTGGGGGGGGLQANVPNPAIPGRAGGSGGGASNGSGTASGGTGISGQGYDGGTNFDITITSNARAGGGGGAAGVGVNGGNNSGGQGGPGINYSSWGGIVGVLAEGGAGGTYGQTFGSPASANTGTGGGSRLAGTTAYDGGSGIVIVRYPV